MNTIRCNIDGREISCEAGTTVLEAARGAGIDIPTLCYFKDLNKLGACRVCVVEIEGMPRLMPSCMTQVREGMVIHTESDRVLEARRQTVDLLCKHHRMDCEYCPHYTFCELHAVVRRLGIDDRKYSEVYQERNADETSRCIVRDYSKCIRCRRCVSACKAQGVEAIGALRRAEGTIIGTLVPMAETNCIGCGQCVRNCPTGALFVRDDTDALWRAQNQKKKIVFGIEPETAANIGRFFGAKAEANELGRLTAVCRKAGVYEVFDLTGLRQAALNELAGQVARMKANGQDPVIVSLCPAEKHREEQAEDVLFGRGAETVFAEAAAAHFRRLGIGREELFLVYISPCTAAKREHDCDAVLTTTELFAWFQRACVSRFTALDVWQKAQPERAVRLFENVDVRLDEADIRLLSACPGGCRNGGGQFRAGAFQK